MKIKKFQLEEDKNLKIKWLNIYIVSKIKKISTIYYTGN